MKVERKGAFFRFALNEQILNKISEFTISWGELDFVILLLLKDVCALGWAEVEKKYGGEQTRVRMDALVKALASEEALLAGELEHPKQLKEKVQPSFIN